MLTDRERRVWEYCDKRGKAHEKNAEQWEKAGGTHQMRMHREKANIYWKIQRELIRD